MELQNFIRGRPSQAQTGNQSPAPLCVLCFLLVFCCLFLLLLACFCFPAGEKTPASNSSFTRFRKFRELTDHAPCSLGNAGKKKAQTGNQEYENSVTGRKNHDRGTHKIQQNHPQDVGWKHSPTKFCSSKSNFCNCVKKLDFCGF